MTGPAPWPAGAPAAAAPSTGRAAAPRRTAPLPADLKTGGIVPQREPDRFTVRVRTPMGRLLPAHLRALAACAERFGSGELHLTVRQTPEILGVPRDALPGLLAALAAAELGRAAAGPVVRAVSGCSGCQVTPNGLVDSLGLGLEADVRFFGRPCPAKFKLTFAGCPTDCVRAKGADLGFVGRVEVEVDPGRCERCGLCGETCREGAITADTTGLPVVDPQACVGCAHCVRACPAGALRAARTGLDVYAGGKHGRHPRSGERIATMITEDQALESIERTLAWYRRHGCSGERLGAALDRLGTEDLAATLAENTDNGPLHIRPDLVSE